MSFHQICSKENLRYNELKEYIDKLKNEKMYFPINSVNEKEETPLMHLCYFNPSESMIMLLIEHGADPTSVDSNRNNCLLYLFTSKAEFDLLSISYLKSKCNIKNINRFGNNILHEVVKNSALTREKFLNIFFSYSKSINEVNNDVQTPLMLLCKICPDLELIKLFIQYKADPKLLDKFSNDCLMYLFLSEKDFDVDIVEYLISRGCNIDQKRSNMSILQTIIYKRAFTIKKLNILLKVKPDMFNTLDTNDNNPLMYICSYYPRLDFIKLFINLGANVKQLSKNEKFTCLYYLFCNCNESNVVDFLISKGCKLEQKFNNNNNILHKIIINKTFNLKKLEMICDYKPNMINQVNKDKISPLMYLCQFYPNLEFITPFTDNFNVNVKLSDKNGMNCLFYLFLSKKDFSFDVVQHIIYKGCSIEKKDKKGNTILHKIISNKVFTTNKLEMLLKLSYMMNEINKDNETPLMLLCKHYPILDFIKLFIDNGANPKISNGSNNCLSYLFSSKENVQEDTIQYITDLM